MSEINMNFGKHEAMPAVERITCLGNLLAQATEREHGSIDAFAEEHLIAGINNAVVEANGRFGEYRLECQQEGCKVAGVWVERRGAGAKGMLTIFDRGNLDECQQNS